MGNAVCIGKHAGLENLCAGRGFPEFIAPNTEHVTYCFSYAKAEDMKLLNGIASPLSSQGLALEPQLNARRATKWYIVKEYTPNPAHLRVHVSGRVFTKCLGATLPGAAASSACAFKICTRGRPIYESIRTDNFTHVAHVVTSGVFFAFNVTRSSQGLVLCPQLVLVLGNGDEVLLVDDRLGPVQPQSFYIDFAILDDGGRNVQVDLIFRGLPSEGSADEGSIRTLRTCLQDYIAFNNQIIPASISFSSSDLSSLLPASAVYLQDLVISEEKFEEQVPEPQPFDVWKTKRSSKILYEGTDARSASMAIDVPEGPAMHPQLQLPSHPGAGPERGPGGLQGSRQGEALVESCTDDFWHHVRYDDDFVKERPTHLNALDEITHLKGEFWLSKQAVAKKNVYFHCSSTFAQAVTMCVAFRFSCPLDYLQLIERAGGGGSGRREAVSLLRDGHIPANGVVLGIEHDPRNHGLLRMFVEHRNEIKDDMVVCECRPADLTRSIVHQEVYDGGGLIMYRLTLLHRDGARQSAVLQMNTEEFEESLLSARPGQYRLMDEPSPRFPISPCQVSQSLSPANRVFVYSAAVYEQPDDAFGSVDTGEGISDQQSVESAGPSMTLYATDCSYMSDATAEDWHSARGGYSDGELDMAHMGGDPSRTRMSAGCGGDPAPGRVEWQRPLIESAVLLSRMDDPPFKCFPTSLT